MGATGGFVVLGAAHSPIPSALLQQHEHILRARHTVLRQVLHVHLAPPLAFGDLADLEGATALAVERRSSQGAGAGGWSQYHAHSNMSDAR